MQADNGNLLIHSILNEYPIFPGHPATISYMIMYFFPNLAAALSRVDKKGVTKPYCAALTDCRIDGTGDAVCNAIRVLEAGRDGMNTEQMFVYADNIWRGYDAGGYKNLVDPGSIQALRLRDKWVHLADQFFKRI